MELVPVIGYVCSCGARVVAVSCLYSEGPGLQSLAVLPEVFCSPSRCKEILGHLKIGRGRLIS